MVCEWEGIFLALFQSEIRGNEGTKCGWFPLWYGDLGRCIVGRDGGCWVFCLFPAWLFGGYDGCERGYGTCGWCGGLAGCDGVGVVEVFYSVAMGVGVGSVGNRGRSV